MRVAVLVLSLICAPALAQAPALPDTTPPPLPPELRPPAASPATTGGVGTLADPNSGWWMGRIPDYRGEIRGIIEVLSAYARGRDPNFSILTRDGFDLLRQSERDLLRAELLLPRGVPVDPATVLPLGAWHRAYRRAVDGLLLDGQYCARTPAVTTQELLMLRDESLLLLALDRCADTSAAAMAREMGQAQGILVAAAASTGATFDQVPPGRPQGENAANIFAVDGARNFLPFLSTRGYRRKPEWLMAMAGTNHDMLIIPPLFWDGTAVTPDEVRSLKFKKLGARRQVLARLSLTRASDTDYFWQRGWGVGNPTWIAAMDPSRPGSFHVQYWHADWKARLGEMMAGIMDLGFDGVVFEDVEGYAYFEAENPL